MGRQQLFGQQQPIKSRGLLAAWLVIPLTLAATLGAVEPESTLEIGATAPAWRDLPGVDGKTHGWADVKDAKAVVVVFTCNTCPYAVDAEDRLISLHQRYASRGVALVAINCNTVANDLPPAMRTRAEQKGFQFPYLHDQSQQIAIQFGASITPEFFVLGPDRKLVYRGAMDDSPDGKAVSKRYVEAAIDSILEGSSLQTTQTPPIGCRIRFNTSSRRRS